MTLREEFLGALAFAGDLTMGQPPEHSPATACLAAKIARHDGAPAPVVARAAQLGMIRWGGCTANAVGFADLFGDDILGRRELLAGRDPFVAKPFPKPTVRDRLAPYLPFFPKLAPEATFYGKVTPLVYSHCEVVGEIARRAGYSPELVGAIDSLFEYWDGSGWPKGKTGGQYDRCVEYVWLASDLEAFRRFHGPAQAIEMVKARGGKVYERSLVETAVRQFDAWMSELDAGDLLAEAISSCALGEDGQDFTLEDAVLLLSDFAELKRPEYTGLSRETARISATIAKDVGASEQETNQIRHGALLSSLGYVSVNSAVLSPGMAPSLETVRLVPYWTERILSRAPSLETAAKIASQVFERLDGTGWHKGLRAEETGLASRIVQVAFVVAECEWKGEENQVAALLNQQAADNRLDPSIVSAALNTKGMRRIANNTDWGEEFQLTLREREVLGELIHGKSNKEIARLLTISPKTVGRHLENCYRKLGVTSRAAAAIKALRSGIAGSRD